MSISNQFNDDASQTRATRFADDQKRITGWLDSLGSLKRLFTHLQDLKGDGFAFVTTTSFEPANAADISSDYVAPTMVREISFVAGADTSNAVLRVTSDCAFTLNIAGNDYRDANRANLLQALENWISELDKDYPALNVLNHIHRADTTPARVDNPLKPKAKPL